MQRAGEDPEPLRLCPALLPKAKETYRTFNRLSAARLRDQGAPLPIQVSEIRHYTEMFGPSHEDHRIVLIDHLQMMDSLYLTHAAEKIKAAMHRPS